MLCIFCPSLELSFLLVQCNLWVWSTLSIHFREIEPFSFWRWVKLPSKLTFKVSFLFSVFSTSCGLLIIFFIYRNFKICTHAIFCFLFRVAENTIIVVAQFTFLLWQPLLWFKLLSYCFLHHHSFVNSVHIVNCSISFGGILERFPAELEGFLLNFPLLHQCNFWLHIS